MEKVLIIDGHSAIHSTSWHAEIHENHQESGREALVREVSQLQEMTHFYVVVVFDGQGPRRGKQGGSEDEILVMYSRGNETADRVIERIAVQQSKKHDVQVASNDRMVLDSCSVSGAHVMSINGMWDLIDHQISQQRKRFRKK